jgi:hypothetical protein
MTTPLQSFISLQALRPVHEAITGLANALRHKHGHVIAVLAYGSALRDSNPDSTLIDYYVLTQNLEDVSSSSLSRQLCKYIPPNVYFHEQRVGAKPYRCKYAVLPLTLLTHKVSAGVANPYFWVRFAQPMQIVWTEDSSTRQRVIEIMAAAIETAFAHARELAPQSPPLQQWTTLFQNTYATELRPESVARAAAIVETQKDYFNTASTLASPVTASQTPWSTRRWQGKLLSVARLLKAAFTFQGGADYAAWKIRRHSGVEIEVTDWQRRHPILASITLLPKLWRKGALK